MKKLLVMGLVLALVAILVAPMAVFATEPLPVTVTGSLEGAVMTVTSPTVPGFGQFKFGENKVASSPDGTVTVVKNGVAVSCYTEPVTL